ncbi:nitroreductase [Dysgonomonas sp. 25]|uniref:Acg family FMN-binding oxidoreductase n=1 Tax=Dysgonomonas sp. 25 TaxID=2302933 RepID=UPI0013CFE165|nr:nitroreductase [Dysgonomonas sp. 25]NDV68891.1 nitroreductase [Dysgonomonas sp. 25]
MKKISLFFIIILYYMASINAQNADHLFMVGEAIKAPSGHNTQPWLFRISDDAIQILPNYDKSLPVVDPDNRELFISLGCAAENLRIAASHKGYAAALDISEEGIITVNLTKDASVEVDSLFWQIAVRQTNRSIYNGQMVSADTINLLKRVFDESPVNAYFYEKGTAEFDSIANYVVMGNVLQMQDKAFKKELRSWMRFNKKHQDEMNDGLSYAVFGAPNLPKFIVKPILSKAVNEKSQNKGDKKKIASSSHFVLLTTASNTCEEWIKLGIILERFLLKSTRLGIIHAYMNQPNEVSHLSAAMAETLNISDEHPTILLRIGYGEKMPYSKRMPVEKVILNE